MTWFQEIVLSFLTAGSPRQMDCLVHGCVCACACVCVRARADVQIDGPVHRHMSRQMPTGGLWGRPGPSHMGSVDLTATSPGGYALQGQGRVYGLVLDCDL